MNKISKLSSLALIAMMILGSIGVFVPKGNAVPTAVSVINTDTGDTNFHYTTDTKIVGEYIFLNITVSDVADLANWQMMITWDSTLLAYSSITRPSDHVFAVAEQPPYSKSMVAPSPIINPGNVTWGCTFINGVDNDHFSFNGTGRLCVLKLKITQGVGEMPPTSVTCTLAIANIGTDSFMLDTNGHDLAFSTYDGDYLYSYQPPTYNPVFRITPATEKPAKIGDTFALDIEVTNVSAGWSIIGFQFSLMWNTTFMTPVAPYYTAGTFLETFQYMPSGVLYVSDNNVHNRPMPLTPIDPQYNFSMFGAILLPDTPTPFHAPFPSCPINVWNKLMTVYFNATYETISPIEDWTYIEFIHFANDEDTYALNQYLHVITCSSELECHYRAPMKILGLSIDLYTQYPFPYGGQGANMTSDMFGPQSLVDLFALVTYNEYPVQQKLVGFQVFHQGATKQYNIYREGTTDTDGVAHVSFRIPWPCADPVGEIFGWWYVNATVEVAGQVVVDNLKFWVWWPVAVLSIEPKQTEFVQRKTGGDDLEFTETYGTYSMQILPVTITATIYDELSFFIGSATYNTTVGLGSYDMAWAELFNKTTPPLVYSVDFTMPLPTNAVVGKGIAFGNAFSALPWLGGYPYCPEVTNTIDFYIKKP